MEPAWQWHVGNPIGTGNDVGAPEVPYMSYGPKPQDNEEDLEEDEKQRELDEKRYRSNRISTEAWQLYLEGRLDEALVFINRALEYSSTNANAWNNKAIILQDLKRFDEALNGYDRAMELGSSEIYTHNKATCLIDYSRELMENEDFQESLERICQSLEIFKEISDKRGEDEAWNLKGVLLERMGDLSGAFYSFKKALKLASDESDMKETYTKNRDRLLHYAENKNIICPKCGNPLKITDNFCVKCGEHVDETARITFKKGSEIGEVKRTYEGENFDETIFRIYEDD